MVHPDPSETQQAWLNLELPADLFGSTAVVKRKWLETTRRAWKAETWDPVADGLRLVRAASLGESLETMSPGAYPSENVAALWRIYLIGECLKEASMEGQTVDTRALWLATRHRLIVDGMQRLWFVLGILDTSGVFPLSFCTDETRVARARAYLARFAYWVPQLRLISPKMTSWFYVKTYGGRYVPEWAGEMLALARACGWNLTIEEVAADYDGDVVGALVAKGILHENEGRFAVVPEANGTVSGN